MKPVVTIIIPVYNPEVLVKATIDSIKKQYFTDFECLLIDDGSTDNSMVSIAESVGDDARFKLFKRQVTYKRGPAGCRNMGLDLAAGTYIQFFDSDDLMHPDHLKLKVAAYQKGSDLVVCQLGEFMADDMHKIFSISSIDDGGDILAHLSGEVNYYLPGPMWKKELIGDFRFEEALAIYKDLLFNVFNRLKCKRVALIEKPLVYYRRHDKSTTATATSDVALLLQKRLAWHSLYAALHQKVPLKRLRTILFKKSCLNLYYLLSQKSLKAAFRELKDIFLYASNIKHYFMIVQILGLMPVTYLFAKGYRFYKI